MVEKMFDRVDPREAGVDRERQRRARLEPLTAHRR